MVIYDIRLLNNSLCKFLQVFSKHKIIKKLLLNINYVTWRLSLYLQTYSYI